MNGERILEDRKFVAGLAGSRAGLILQSHIACVSKYEEGNSSDSSAQETLSNERVLIAAIARSLAHGHPMPCGLPSPLPKFIAICNLSGERLLLHGSSPSILRKLCTRSSILSPRDVAQQILAFECFPNIDVPHVEKFVLLSYSLPWQAGAGSAFWSVSCCDYRVDDRHMRDRMLTFTSQSHMAFRGKSVLDPSDASVLIVNNTAMPMVTAKQMKALTQSFCCCSLDAVKDQDIDSSGGGLDSGSDGVKGDASKKQLQLEKITHALKQDRAKDHDEIKRLKNEQCNAESEMLQLVEQCELRVNKLAKDQKDAMEAQGAKFDETRAKAKELLDLEKSHRSALNAELNALKMSYEEKAIENAEANKTLQKLRSKMEEQRRQSAAKDQLGNKASSKFNMQIKVLEDNLETAKAELLTTRQDLEDRHHKKSEERAAAHSKDVKRLRESIESKERIVNQLSEVSERRGAEIESLQAVDALRGAELEENERVIEALKAELAAAQAELAKPKTRSVGVSTSTSSTSTHSCATTQTPPPRPSTPLPKPTVVVKDTDVTTDTATTTMDSEASSGASNIDAVALCQSAEIAVQKLVAHVLNGQTFQWATHLPTSQSQFLHPNPNQLVCAHPLPQYFPPPQYFPQQYTPIQQQQQQQRHQQQQQQQQHRVHKSHGSVRHFRE